MCMLTYLPAGQQPDLKALTNGAESNWHGHGYAILVDDHIIVGRSLDATSVIDEFAAARAEHPYGPALFHSRYGTHGSVIETNCHPFPVGGDHRTVLAHNGILPDAVHPGEHDHRSDTRIAAEDFLPRRPFGSLATATARRRLERWLGRYNKILILTVDPVYRDNAILLNEREGIWDNGIWYSNSDYQWSPSASWGHPVGDERRRFAWSPQHLQFCEVCETDGSINSATGYCGVCGACADCQTVHGECMCYPATYVPMRDAGGSFTDFTEEPLPTRRAS